MNKKLLLLAMVAVLIGCLIAVGLTACDKNHHEHTYETQEVAPTCTEQGYILHTCSVCQDSYKDTFVQALGHSFTDYVSDGNATCTEDGTKTAICNRDGCDETDTLTETGTKLGHNYGEPVWTWTGYERATATFTCANDGAHVEIETATGVAITSEITTSPTCTTDGVRTYTAIVTFGVNAYTDKNTETIQKLGHVFTNYVSNDNATCTEDGTKTAICDRDGCDETDTLTETGTKLGHNYGAPVWTWTGYESAKATFTCTNDGAHVETETATGAAITSKITTPPTCTMFGLRTYTATVSFDGKTFTNQKTEYISALGHDYNAVWTWTGYESATADFTCTHDASHIGSETATGENITNEITTPPTCTEEGVRTYTATVSFGGKTYTGTKTESIPATGHTLSDNVCTVCNYDAGGSKGLNMVLNAETNTYSLNGIGSCTDAAIEIPATYDGLPVTGIGANAFKNCTSITSITIPGSVTSIGTYAFSKCTSLSNVSMSEGLTEIGTYAFDGCTSLTSVAIPDSVVSILADAFQNCTSIVSVTFGADSNLTALNPYAFYSCTSLTSITIPEGVTEIGKNAFLYCYKLIRVYDLTGNDGANALNITAGSADYGYVGYYAVNVYTDLNDGANDIYTDGNGYVIYANETDEKILVGYSGTQSQLTIPDGITKVFKYAFYGNTNITSVTIPDSVTNIGEHAFEKSNTLESLIFGKNSGLISIDTYAFYDCTALSNFEMPQGVTAIASFAFGKCSFESIEIPVGVTTIGERTFFNCTELRSITLPDGLITIEKNAFTGCSKLESVALGNSLTSIGNSAFSGCSALTSVTIGDGVESIGVAAFMNCSSLECVIIGSSVNRFGGDSFTGCTSLEKVFYKGTESDWNSIAIDTGNSALNNLTKYYYSETAPETEGNFWHYVDGAPTVW